MTESENRFCTTCGAALEPRDAFCVGCGTPAIAPEPSVSAPEPEPPVPGPATTPDATAAHAPGERPVAIIGNLTEASGFMGMKHTAYTLVITDRRIIFAELTRERMTAAVNQARDAAKAAGKGFMGQWGAQIGTSFNYHETYGRMSPDAILAETPGNFALERSGIQGVKFKTGITDDNGASTPDVMVIKTGSGKHKLQVNGALGTVKEAFRRAGIS